MAGLGSLSSKGFRDKSASFFQRIAFANATVDRVEAYKWFTLSMQAGHSAAARDLSLLRRLMSAEQLKRAERKIEDCVRERKSVREFPD